MAATNGAIVYRGLFGTIFGMVRHEGFRSLYGGIVPGLQRQCLFASIRIGLYEPVKDFYTNILQLGKQLRHPQLVDLIKWSIAQRTRAMPLLC